MTRTIRILTLLAAMIITAGHAWAEDIAGYIYYDVQQTLGIGHLRFYTSVDAADPDNVGEGYIEILSDKKRSTDKYSGTVYIRALHYGQGYTVNGMTINVEVSTGTGSAQAPRRTPDVGEPITVNPVEGHVGLYQFTMPSDGSNVTVTATFAANPAVETKYIDAYGKEQTVDAIPLDGAEDQLGAYGTWYVASGTVAYDHGLKITGSYQDNSHVILADGCNMTVTAPLRAIEFSNPGLTLNIYGQSGGTGSLTATGTGSGNTYGISKENWDNTAVIINGGRVTANGGTTGIYAGNITINGGQVTATGFFNGISADNITLGWKNATDRIKVSEYNGNVKITKTFTDGTNTYLGDLSSDQKTAIAGKTLFAANEVAYIDKDGNTQTATNVIALDGTETDLSAHTYVAIGIVNYDHTLTLSGDVTLILADGCKMNVGKSDGRINGRGITRNLATPLTIYGQSAGSGTLSVYTTGNNNHAIIAKPLIINGGNVIADTNGDYACALNAADTDLTINGGTVNATTAGYYAHAIFAAFDFNYNGGNVTATAANAYSINPYGKHYTFNWRNATDRITIGATGLYSDPDEPATATFSKLFTDGTTVLSGTVTDLSALAGKTLSPANIIVMPSEHGSVVPNTYYAAEDATVTLTVTPDDGYTLKSISATGVTLAAVDNQPTKRTFTMPDANVTISATWELTSSIDPETEVTEEAKIEGGNAEITKVGVGAGTTSITISGTVSDGTNNVPVTSIADDAFIGVDFSNVQSVSLKDTQVALTGDVRNNGPLSGIPENVIVVLPKESATAYGTNVVTTDDGINFTCSEVSIVENKIFINGITDFTTHNFSFDRTFLTGVGQYNTVFLPIYVPATIAATFGTFYTCSSVDANGAVLTQVTGDLTANTAYVYKPADGKSKIEYNGSETLTIKMNNNVTNPTGAGLKGTNVRGTISQFAADPSKAYGYAAEAKDGATVGAFCKLTSDATVPAYRGWLEVEDASSPQLAIIIEGEGATSIRSIDGVPVNEGTYYDLNGRKLSTQPTAKGVYIHNGRKVVVK